jgi:predicted nucleic acid-binding protein
VSLRAYLDTNVVIRGMERTDAGADAIGRLFDLAEASKVRLVTNELTLGEVLVLPFKAGDDRLARAYEHLLAEGGLIELRPITREILAEAARIRARSGAALTDALHAATAVLCACGVLISYDRRLHGLTPLEVVEPTVPLLDKLERQSA